jgi:hypothetical protein
MVYRTVLGLASSTQIVTSAFAGQPNILSYKLITHGDYLEPLQRIAGCCNEFTRNHVLGPQCQRHFLSWWVLSDSRDFT